MVLSQPEPRIPVDLDMRVWGMGADGHAFSQHARAHNISAGGAMLCSLDRDLKIGDTIGVQSGDKKARCKVVWTTNTRSSEKIKAGVQLLNKPECPWIALLCRTDRPAPNVVPGRRRWERHKITFLISLYDERTTVPLRVTATDISGSGCYVETLSPLAIGVALGAELWMGMERLTTRALVRTSDPRVGMGIEFVGLKIEEQRRFQDHLQAVDPFSCSIERKSPKFKTKPN